MCHSNTHLNVPIYKVLTWSEYISRGWVALSIKIKYTATIVLVVVFWCYIINILGIFNSILNPRPQCWENVAEMIEPPKPLVLTSKHFPMLLWKHLPWLFCFKTALRCAGKYQIPTFVDRARLGRVDIFAPFFDSLLGRHLVWTWKIQLSFLTNIMTKDNLFERFYVKLYWMLQRKLGYLIAEIS